MNLLQKVKNFLREVGTLIEKSRVVVASCGQFLVWGQVD
jgi:hypothetical protein